MLNTKDILETIRMIDDENLDIRTITMGISLLSCADSDINMSCSKIYDKICRLAEKLVTVSMYSLAERPAVLYALAAYSCTFLALSLNSVSTPPTSCS